jgi:hypothetical protein
MAAERLSPELARVATETTKLVPPLIRAERFMKPGLVVHRMPPRLRRSGLSEVISGWGRLLNRFSALEKTYEKDVPYWYGERALTGLLAAAAWKLPQGWSLEEFTGLRNGDEGKRSARGDLWFGTSAADFTVEAKVVWASSTWQVARTRTNEQLADASQQLRDLERSYRVGTRIALCYVVPCPRANRPEAQSANLASLLSNLPLSYTGPEWITARYARPGGPAVHDGYVYPGVVLVGKVVAWAPQLKGSERAPGYDA